MSKPKKFKPKFNGSMIVFLHDEMPEMLAWRAKFTEDWLPEGRFSGGKRGEIMGRKRKFEITLSIVDKDGFTCGQSVIEFTSKGNQKDLTKNVFNHGNALVDEIRAKHPEYDIDLTQSNAEVRV